MKNLLLIISIFILNDLKSQKEFSNWYFGKNLGVTFRNDSVLSISNSSLDNREGCATVSDEYGNVLFYGNGSKLYNRKNRLMLNGTGLKGDASTSQGIIIVPKPESKGIYYVFTVNGVSGNPLFGAYYSEVDMSLDSGLGGITSLKNKNILDKTDEKITATLHSNGVDVWVLVNKGTGANTVVYSYLVTKDGVNENPVISDLGLLADTSKNIFKSKLDIGCMKVSLDGKKVAMAYEVSETIVLANFDNNTGYLSNGIAIATKTDEEPYGIEFSPNSRFLYVTITKNPVLLQYDLKSYSKKSIEDSRFDIANSSKLQVCGSVQLAINGKIYITSLGGKKLSVINYPDLYGDSSFLEINKIPESSESIWNQGLCRMDLPQRVVVFNRRIVHESLKDSCKFKEVLSLNDTTKIDLESILWSLDSGISFEKFNPPYKAEVKVDSFKVLNVAVVFRIKNSLRNDTIYDKIFIDNHDDNYKWTDTIILCNDSVLLSKCDIFNKRSYLWNTGDTTCSIFAKTPGRYHVVFYDDKGCVYSDSTHIVTYAKPVLRSDTMLCSDDSILLTNITKDSFLSYRWNTGDTAFFCYGKPGNVYVLYAVDMYQCVRSDTVLIGKQSGYQFDLGNDTIICEDNRYYLKFSNVKGEFLWQDSSKSDSMLIGKTGIYHLTVKDGSCEYSDSLEVVVVPRPKIHLIDTMYYCGLNELRLNAYYPGADYLWSTGEKTSEITVSKPGVYKITINQNGCIYQDSTILISKGESLVFFPNAITPNFDGINDEFPSPWNEYVYSLEIYNRWGELIYQGSEAWDAHYKHEIVPEGIYMFIITYIDCIGRRWSESGTLTVIY